MKRKHFLLPDPLQERLTTLVEKTDVNESAHLRLAIEEYLARKEKELAERKRQQDLGENGR